MQESLQGLVSLGAGVVVVVGGVWKYKIRDNWNFVLTSYCTRRKGDVQRTNEGVEVACKLGGRDAIRSQLVDIEGGVCEGVESQGLVSQLRVHRGCHNQGRLGKEPQLSYHSHYIEGTGVGWCLDSRAD